MSKNQDTSALIDGILKVAAGSAFMAAGLVAPQILLMLDKPAHKLLDTLDEREKRRKLSRTIIYMKTKGLVTGSYSHGITITKKGQQRLQDLNIANLKIEVPEKWDNTWRMVFFDIPETQKIQRQMLTGTLKRLGYQLLQRSIWIHPFSSRAVIERVCQEYNVAKWVTYVETRHIDHQEELIERFRNILKS